jgi:SAM-dependent methyltransferase
MVHVPFSRTISSWWARREILHELKKNNWQFSNERLNFLLTEDWNRYYLPVDMTGLIVLDVGAGEGETARFFLNHGASKVICIEPEPNAFELLKRNSANHPGKLEIYQKLFDLNDLSMKFDFMKMDIEGYEESLLDNTPLAVPAVIEVHGLQLKDKFRKQNYRIDDSLNAGGRNCISFAYWKC